MHTGSGRVRYFLDHMFRELTVCFRKPVNLFCYLFVYISYAFLLTLCGENKTLFTVFTCAAITLICVGSEEIYRSDVRTNIYYRLFGESYGRFLEKKVLTTALLALVVWLLGAIRAVFLSPAPSASAVFIIPYTLFNILYWNLYDFCRFMHLPESETLPEMTLDLLALAGMFLPVVNLILCVRFYKKGKERWWSES